MKIVTNINYKFIPMLYLLSKYVTSGLKLDIPESYIQGDFSSNDVGLSCSGMLYNFLNEELSYDVTYTDSENTILTLVSNSDLATTHKGVYLLLSSVLAESLALNYYITNDKTQFQNTSSDRILNTRNNLKFLCNWFGDYNKYWDFIPILRVIDTSLGYIENQTTFLVDNINYSTNNLD